MLDLKMGTLCHTASLIKGNTKNLVACIFPGPSELQQHYNKTA